MSDRLVERFEQMSVEMKDDTPVNKMIAGLLLQVQEFICASGLNEDFMTLDNADLIRIARRMSASDAP